MTTQTRSRKSPASTPEVDLPTVTNETFPAPRPAITATFPLCTIHVRYFDPQTGRTFAITFNDVELPVVELRCDEMERNGYVPCQSPDAPDELRTPEQKDSVNRDERRSEAPPPQRAGQRTTKPKGARLVLPFALNGQYKGWTLDQIEENDPSAIDWIAKNALMNDIKNAAQKIANQRDDLPF